MCVVCGTQRGGFEEKCLLLFFFFLCVDWSLDFVDRWRTRGRWKRIFEKNLDGRG